MSDCATRLHFAEMGGVWEDGIVQEARGGAPLKATMAALDVSGPVSAVGRWRGERSASRVTGRGPGLMRRHAVLRVRCG
jgi:hypothetical protein